MLINVIVGEHQPQPCNQTASKTLMVGVVRLSASWKDKNGDGAYNTEIGPLNCVILQPFNE